MKYVIARNKGPNMNGLDIFHLTRYKSYKVCYKRCREYDSSKGYEVWKKRELKYNPKKPRFYITVIDDFNNEYTFWNDYFLSTKEMRVFKLNNIINESRSK